mmetsp:Transcript_74371/g.170579  ORF Transcript_74371/g.170579 Transcript_74371/m.170579 type:complete len:122 (+) Transcript_74371:225-590(+)
MAQSQALIQKLLKAEEDAEQIITRAREGRVKKLQAAKESAQADLDQIRAAAEAEFQTNYGAAMASDGSSDLSRLTEREIHAVAHDFTANGDKVTKYIFDKVVSVNLELTEIQKSTLVLGGA